MWRKKIISSKCKDGDRTTILRIYWSHIRSKLYYCCVVYGSGRSLYPNNVLNLIANQGLRLCLSAFRTSTIESIKVKTGRFQARRLKPIFLQNLYGYTSPSKPKCLGIWSVVLLPFWKPHWYLLKIFPSHEGHEAPWCESYNVEGNNQRNAIGNDHSSSVVRLPVDKPALASTTTQYRAKDVCASELGPLRI